MKKELKEVLNKMPVSLKKAAYQFYFSHSQWKGYKKASDGLRKYQQLSLAGQKEYIFKRMKRLVEFVWNKNPFYSDFYKSKGFSPAQLRSFEDIEQIPIVNKTVLIENYKAWLQPSGQDIWSNTGGSSGSPLKFIISRDLAAKESFYMHQMWGKMGCTLSSSRLVFRGANLGDIPLMYDMYSGGYMVNAYISLDRLSMALLAGDKPRAIEFLHGYPSFIYQFALFCKGDSATLEFVNKELKAILLCSEFPAPHYMEVVQRVFNVPVLSWYGHSEFAVLAMDCPFSNEYTPFQSYGFCEGVLQPTGQTHLIGTCYDNFKSPFIRYDTEDSIEIQYKDEGVVTSFSIAQGRVGEFVVDKEGNQISLTALIFGRHHKLFEYAEFIQVYQKNTGEALICVVFGNNMELNFDENRWETLFDYAHVNMDFTFRKISKPYRTASGKVPLLITDEVFQAAENKREH